jgi:hypothetical protein
MATIPLSGLTTPFLPNSGIAAFDTNSVPEQVADFPATEAASTVLTSSDLVDFSPPSATATAPNVVRVLAVTQTDTQLQVTLDRPVIIDPGTETHLASRHWFFGSPTTSNTFVGGTLTHAIGRLLNRLSKMNRGIH